MKVVCIVQARMNSQRLPQKVLKDVCGMPAIERVLNRVGKAETIDMSVLATSADPADDSLAAFAAGRGYPVFRGSGANVLARYYFCAKENNADIILRVTGDNLLVDPAVIDAAIRFFMKEKTYDYIKYGGNLPVGMAVEVFTLAALEKSYQETKDPVCLEHVTPYIYKNKDKFHLADVPHGTGNYTHLRWTMDTAQDYELIVKIYQYFTRHKGLNGEAFGIWDILAACETHPEWAAINKDVPQVQV